MKNMHTLKVISLFGAVYPPHRHDEPLSTYGRALNAFVPVMRTRIRSLHERFVQKHVEGQLNPVLEWNRIFIDGGAGLVMAPWSVMHPGYKSYTEPIVRWPLPADLAAHAHAVPTSDKPDPPLSGRWIKKRGLFNTDKDAIDRGVILYIHGGAFVMASSQTHYELTRQLVKYSEAAVFSLDYRLSPEYPFPYALQDALSAYTYLIEQGYPPHKIVLAGESAGANLALALAYYLIKHKTPLPAGVICFAPWLDLADDGKNSPEEEKDLIPPELLSWASDFYVAPSQHKNRDFYREPLVSPLYGSDETLSSLPNLLIHSSTYDVLHSQSEKFYQRLQELNSRKPIQSNIHYSVWSQLPHAFQIAAGMPEANASLREAAAFARLCIGGE